MLPAELHGVVGIDVANEAPVVCALAAPRGTIRHKPRRIDATADGFALRCSWRQPWGAREQILIGLAATGPLWEPLYADLTRAGDAGVLLNPPQTASWASRLGRRAKTAGIAMRRPWHAAGWPVGRAPVPCRPRPCRRCGRGPVPGAI